MHLKTKVKVGNISNLSDARYCAGFGVDMLGFNIDPSDPGHISLDTAREIMGWVSVGHIILECGQMPLEQIEKISQESGIRYIQTTDQKIASTLKHQGYQVILAINVDSVADLAVFDHLGPNEYDYLMVDSNNEQLFSSISDKIGPLGLPVLKGFDVTGQNVGEIIHNPAFSGIALKGSVEDRPGFKDYDELAEILEFLEVED